MAFREVIEAVLKVKDANRFKAGMDKAARAVKHFGHDSEAAAAQTEILERIEKRLERQSVELTAALHLVADAVNEVGDEMEKTAAKAVIANQVMKKSGSNAVFLGKSWAFWKDRLSLTRSELLTTALTIGTYFSPALIAMGSSFAYAALGGGGVAFGGLSTLALGFVSLYSVMKPVTDGIKKVMKAQDQYNVAVQQYGAASIQASRASGHLFGIIQTNGGKQVLDITNKLRCFRTEWAKATAPGRRSLLDVVGGGLSAGKTLMPTVATGTNGIAAQLQATMKGVFKTLSGGEFQGILRSLFQTFDKAIGPGLRGATNLIMVLGRVAVAAGPWVVKWAKAWERTTASWRKSTKDTSKLTRFFSTAMKHFKAWWGLAKELARTLKIVFGVSNREGLKFVGTLTDLVTKFNNWLIKMRDQGKIDKFWRAWEKGLQTAFFIILHPVQAFQRFFPQFINLIDTYMPVVINHIATAFLTAAPIIANTFITTFFRSNAWGKAFLLTILLQKFGVFRALGRLVAAMFVLPFIRAFTKAFLAQMGLNFAEEGAIGAAMTRWGGRSGRLFGGAMVLGIVAGIVAFAPQIDNAIRSALGLPKVKGNLKDWIVEKFNSEWKDLKHQFHLPDLNPFNNPPNLPHPNREKRPGGALGGIIPPNGSAFVGESGPELATASPWGTQITPLGRNSRHTLPSAMDLPNLQSATRVTVHSYLQVDKREIAKAVTDQVAYETARRSGRAKASRG